MCRRNYSIVSVFLVSILALSGMLFGQRLINLTWVWGDMRVLGDDHDDMSGWEVTSGDVNGDGYEDIIIGAPNTNPGVRSKVYVIFGASLPPSTIDLNSQSADITIYDDYCGSAIASGDVNNDGYDDIIIGDPSADPPGRLNAGETYVIFGSSSPPSIVDLSTDSANITIYGDDAGDNSGHAVASGDINNDGYDDIIIGAHEADPPGGGEAGETYVIFGFSPPIPVIIDLSIHSANITIYGDEVNDRTGQEVASGDINGDGYCDIIIGAPRANTGGSNYAGKTYIIFGSSFSSPPYTIDLNTQPADITIYGKRHGDRLGKAVVSGDVNGDGYYDIIIGAPGFDRIGRADSGETYVIFSSSFSSPPYTINLYAQPADITISGEHINSNCGHALGSGDLNCDRRDDIIFGVYEGCIGKANVIFGSSDPPSTIDLRLQSADITVRGNECGDRTGHSLATGDVNGDGFADIIIGAPHAETAGGTFAGQTYLISGGGAIITAHGFGGMSRIRAFSLLGRKWGDFFVFGSHNTQGEVHLAVGDIDGDGLDELAAGQGEGGDSIIKLLEMKGTSIRRFKAFGTDNPLGEVHLAIGNFNSDLSDNEIAAAHGEGGQSLVKVFRTDGSQLRKFRAFGPPNAQGEVHLASGDLENNDGIDEIIAGMGEGGSSWVKIFSHQGTFIRKFKAFGPLNTQGEVHLAVGDVDGDGLYEIAAGQGYGGDSWVKLFERDGTFIRTFKAFGAGGNPNGEVHITAADMDNDGICEIICAHGEGGSSQVKVFKSDGTFIRSFKAFGATNTQGEVHLAKSNY